MEIASKLIYLVNDSMKVVGVQRLKSRITGKPGLVKINLSNLEEKKWYCERKVKGVEQYKNRCSSEETNRTPTEYYNLTPALFSMSYLMGIGSA